MHLSTLQLPGRDGPSYALRGFKAITPAERRSGAQCLEDSKSS
jgi:hypothetical protein